MKTLELSKATMPLGAFARQWDGKPLIITSRGKPIVAVVDVRGMDAESLARSFDPKSTRSSKVRSARRRTARRTNKR